MSDPCWLPSAIMQTTAALIGFYAVIYVLTFEKTEEDKIVLKRIAVLDFLFLIILLSSFITIALNALWLDSLSTHVLLQNDLFDMRRWYPIYLFLATLCLMAFYTVLMLQLLHKK